MKSTEVVLDSDSLLLRKQYLTLYKYINKAVNLYEAIPHVLQHTYLPYLAGMNVDQKRVQEVFRREDIQITMNTYMNIRERQNSLF